MLGVDAASRPARRADTRGSGANSPKDSLSPSRKSEFLGFWQGNVAGRVAVGDSFIVASNRGLTRDVSLE